MSSNDKVIFYYNPMSRGRIVHWMLEELGAPYEIKLLNWESGDHKKPEFLKINPMGKIPAIQHRGVVVTETPAICAYLADAYPEAGLAPALNDPQRGTYYRWLFFAASPMEYALLDNKFPRVNPAPIGRIGYGTYADTVATLEMALNGKKFILGEKFSAADVFLSSALGWGLMNNDIDAKQVFLDYVARCRDRPACKRVDQYMAK